MPAYVTTHNVLLEGDMYVPGNTPTNLRVASIVQSDNDTLTDGNDELWTIGELVSEDSLSLTENVFFTGSASTPHAGNFVGTVLVNGTEYPVFFDDSFVSNTLVYYRVAFNNEADATAFAADFQATGIQTPVTLFNTNTFIACFAAGTDIATPQGEVAVETLEPGDMVRTQDGRDVAVKWLGQQKIHPAFDAKKRPILIRKGALGDNAPHRDLVITADHGLVFDGMIVNAGALVNGSSIVEMPLDDLPTTLTVYHVETEAHEALMANGVAAESFVDMTDRAAFDNVDEYYALYGIDRIISVMDLPRIPSQRLVPAELKARLGIETRQIA